MCGIIGIVGRDDSVPHLIEGLRRLEYRGYDSAGVAVLVDGQIARRRARGKLRNLEAVLKADPLNGHVGIGHIRWATHGGPSEHNAHPHASETVAVVHNGIIENFHSLREALSAEGHIFETDTDTEVVVHFLTQCISEGLRPRQAVAKCLKHIRGAFALAILFASDKDTLYGARVGSPLALGWGDGEMYLGSDALALGHLTSRLTYLEEGDWVEVTQTAATIFDKAGTIVDRPIKLSAASGALIGKGNYPHFMLKEIYEQPSAIGDTLSVLINPTDRTVRRPELPFNWANLSRLTIIGCGTSYYAGLTAKYWFEGLARLPVEVDIASEFRYREAPMPAGGAALFISQSGETSDTMAALQYCKAQKQHLIGVVNVQESSIDRACDATFLTKAGPEIGVASTKAFTTQLTVLGCLAIVAARARGAIDQSIETDLCCALTELPSVIADVLKQDAELHAVAQSIMKARDVLYLGRGSCFPIALEGALKLKEISYIHAEGYAAGEMKHGPIALIDENVPVIVCAPSDRLFEKTASNLQEVAARGGRVILLSDTAGITALNDQLEVAIALPQTDPFVTPILYSVPVQLLAYHVAVLKGTDVDQPRNLAKSVTVE